MKLFTTITTLMILALTLLVSGCGGAGKTSASLQVVNGFLVSANGFDGGLIIYGKSDTGEEFSVTLTNSLTTTLEVPNGTWTFRAIGWEGDNTDLTMKFSNIPRCGWTKSNLTGGDITVSLKMDPTHCDDDQFAALGYRNAGTLRDFGDFLTTKSMMIKATLTDRPDQKEIAASYASSTVINNLPTDMISPVKSVRVFALKKEIGKEFVNGFSSKCMPATNGVANKSPYGARAFRLPTRGVPLRVEMYLNGDCTELISGYNFPNGFEGPSDGDFLFHVETPSNTNRLVLVGTDIKKGYSSTYAHMPSVQCNNGTEYACATIPSALPDFVITAATNQNIFIKMSIPSCTGVTIDTPLTKTCSVATDGISLTVNASSASPTATYNLNIPAPASLNFVIGILSNSPGANKKFTAYSDMINGVGAAPFSSYRKTFLNGKDDNDDDSSRDAFGRLGVVREHLSPAGAMGLFGVMDKTQTFRNNCHLLSGTREITLPKDDGNSETYRVVVNTIPASMLTPPAYVCNTADPDATTCGTYFDKKIKVYNLAKSDSVPEMTYALDCDSMIGKFEKSELEIRDSNTRKELSQQILTWNTDPTGSNAYQRYEYLSRWQGWNFSGTWNQVRDYREMGRVFKTGLERVQLLNFAYSSEYDGSVWNQFLESRNSIIVPTSGTLCLDNNSTGIVTDATKDFVFTDSGLNATRLTMTDITGSSGEEMGYLSSWNTVAIGATTSVCSTTNTLLGLPTNNATINGTIPTAVDQLDSPTGLTTAFGTFLNF